MATFLCLSSRRSTVVEHSPRHPKDEGLSRATAASTGLGGGRKWRKEWTDVVVEIVSTTKIIIGITKAEKLERLLPASTFAKVLYF